MNRFDIYWAQVKFQDSDGMKCRPALVIAESQDAVSVLKITSQGKSRDYQFPIQDWEAAGLTKPSYINYSPVIHLPKDNVGKKMGQLTIADRMRFEMRILNRLG